MKLRLLNFIFWLFLAISFFLLCLPETFLSFNKGNVPQLRQVMIISDMMFKMRDKLHVCKYSQDCIGLIDTVPLGSGVLTYKSLRILAVAKLIKVNQLLDLVFFLNNDISQKGGYNISVIFQSASIQTYQWNCYHGNIENNCRYEDKFILIKVRCPQNFPENFLENFRKIHQGPQGLWMGPKGPPAGAKCCNPPQELEKAREAG